MALQDYSFRPTLGGTLATVVATALFLGLTLWQLDRADQKREREARLHERMEQAPLVYRGQPVDLDEQRFRRIEMIGRFLPEHQILLDNVVHKGRAGYEVVTPFRLAEGGATVLVNRGWVPAGPTRQDLPAVSTPEERLEIAGRIDKPRSRPVVGGDTAAGADRRWIWLDLGLFEARTGLEVPDFLVLLSPEAPGGFVRDWPEYSAKIGMHIGYAIHWAAFALMALGTYVWVSLKRRRADGSVTGMEP
jgi:surfeit locus 1 family protein